MGLPWLLILGGVLLGAAFGAANAFGLTALVVISLLVLSWRITGSERLGWLLLSGFVAGVLELWADWIHVEHLGSLRYADYFGFRLLASPSTMPIGWSLTVVPFGYLALRLGDFWPPWRAVALVSALGMGVPPWYEEIAAQAQAWHYLPAGPMLSHTPLWVILTYGGCLFSVATMALLAYRRGSWGRAAVGGVFTGAGILLSGVLFFSLFA